MNTHKEFGFGCESLRERRLIWFAGPEVPKDSEAVETGADRRRRLDEVRQQIEDVTKYLMKAADASGDPKLVKFMSDPETRRNIVGLVVFPSPGAVRYLPKRVQEYLVKKPELIADMQKQLKELKEKMAKESVDAANDFNAALDSFKEGRKNFKTVPPSVPPEPGVTPSKPPLETSLDTAQGILEKLPDGNALNAKREVLLDILQAVVRADEKDAGKAADSFIVEKIKVIDPSGGFLKLRSITAALNSRAAVDESTWSVLNAADKATVQKAFAAEPPSEKLSKEAAAILMRRKGEIDPMGVIEKLFVLRGHILVLSTPPLPLPEGKPTVSPEIFKSRAEILQVLEKQMDVLSDDDKKKLEDTEKLLDAEIEKIGPAKKKEILDKFQDRYRYLTRFGGTDSTFFIWKSVENNGTFNFPYLEQQLKVFSNNPKLTLDPEIKTASGIESPDGKQLELRDDAVTVLSKKYGPAIDAPTLQKNLALLLNGGDTGLEPFLKELNKDRRIKVESTDMKDDLLWAWNPKAMREQLALKHSFVKNPEGISIPSLLLRARLPQEVATELSGSGMDVNAGRVIELAGIKELAKVRKLPVPKLNADGVPVKDTSGKPVMEEKEVDCFSDALVTFILDRVQAAEPGKINRIGKRELVELLTFLEYQKDPAKSKGKTVEDKRQEIAKWVKETLETDGTLLHEGDDYYKINREKFDEKLKKRQLGWIGIQHKALRESGISDIEWPQTVKMTITEIADLGTSVWSYWWPYVKSIPGDIGWKRPEDDELLKILDKGAALGNLRNGIDRALNVDTSGEKTMKRAEEVLTTQRKKEVDRLRDLKMNATRVGDHVEHGTVLLKVAYDIVEQIDREHGFRLQSPLARQVALWIAMNNTEAEARTKLQEFFDFVYCDSVLHKDPDARIRAYIESQIAGTDREFLLGYVEKNEAQEEMSGENRLTPLEHRGIRLRAAPLELLASHKLSGSLGTWDDDRDKAGKALRLVIEGEGAESLIEAFEGRLPRGREYDFKGKKMVFTAEDATLAAREIQSVLLEMSRVPLGPQSQQLAAERFAENPITAGLAGAVNTLKELWSGDNLPDDRKWVGKAEAIVAVVAGIWLLRKIWSEGWKKDAKGFWKLGALAMVALPIATIANEVYKRKTGRDFLGEKLRYVPKGERATPIEQLLRRSSVPRYQELFSEAGHAARQELLSERDPVLVADLLNWRRSMKQTPSGTLDYSHGAPANLSLGNIIGNLGYKGTKQDAYRISFLNFEALCVQVAELRGLGGGDSDGKAERGAKYIEENYVALNGRQLTMAQVLNAELAGRDTAAMILQDRTFVEWLGDATGLGYEKVRALLIKGYTTAQIRLMKTSEKIGEYWEGGKEWILSTWPDVEKWLRLSAEKSKWEVTEAFTASWRMVWETGKTIGMSIKTKGPGVAEFVFDKTVSAGRNIYDTLNEIHATLLTFPETSYVRAFEDSVFATFGINFMRDLDEPEAEKQTVFEENSDISFFSGNDDGMRSVTQTHSISTLYPSRLSRNIIVMSESAPVTLEKMKANFKKAWNDTGKALYNKKYEDLNVGQQRMVREALETQMYQNIASNTQFREKQEALEKDLKGALQDEKSKSQAHDQAKMQVGKLRDDLKDKQTDLKLAWETPIAELQTRLEAEHAKFNVAISEGVTNTGEIAKLELELRGDPGMWRKPLAKIELSNAYKRREEIRQRMAKAKVEGAKLEAYVEIAKLPMRTPASAAALAARCLSSRPPNPAMADIINKALLLHNECAVLQTQIEKGDKDLKIAEEALTAARTKVRTLRMKGPETIPIDADTLMKVDKSLVKNVFKLPGTSLDTILFRDAYFEPYNILETVPLDSLLGSAREKVLKEVDVWKLRRLSYDKAYQDAVKSGKEPDLVSTYSLYLDRIGRNEVFRRILSTSTDGGEGEVGHYLHLSLSEARTLDQYLQERGQLVTFSQFRNSRKELLP